MKRVAVIDGVLDLHNVVVPRELTPLVEDRITLDDIDNELRQSVIHFSISGQFFENKDLPQVAAFVESLPHVKTVDISENLFHAGSAQRDPLGECDFIKWISALVRDRRILVNIRGNGVFKRDLLPLGEEILERIVWVPEEDGNSYIEETLSAHLLWSMRLELYNDKSEEMDALVKQRLGKYFK